MIGDLENLEVDELVVLKKFEGEPLPENEFERITVFNGEVVAHEKIENGEVTGPVESDSLLGNNIGPFLTK